MLPVFILGLLDLWRGGDCGMTFFPFEGEFHTCLIKTFAVSAVWVENHTHTEFHEIIDTESSKQR